MYEQCVPCPLFIKQYSTITILSIAELKENNSWIYLAVLSHVVKVKPVLLDIPPSGIKCVSHWRA